jgi:hypothetical protein
VSGEGILAAAPSLHVNAHRHGRWVGIFKLSEECGELIDAVCAFMQGEETGTAAVVAETGDVRAAVQHVIEANGLNLARIEDRVSRLLAWPTDIGSSEAVALMRRAGQLVQLLGKIAAFPDGEEHPDGHGNLPGRLEVAIADLQAALNLVVFGWMLDRKAIDERHADKLIRFRIWFPAKGAAR